MQVKEARYVDWLICVFVKRGVQHIFSEEALRIEDGSQSPSSLGQQQRPRGLRSGRRRFQRGAR